MAYLLSAPVHRPDPECVARASENNNFIILGRAEQHPSPDTATCYQYQGEKAP